MPPGTGDAQINLGQRVPLSGAVIVSTPQVQYGVINLSIPYCPHRYYECDYTGIMNVITLFFFFLHWYYECDYTGIMKFR